MSYLERAGLSKHLVKHNLMCTVIGSNDPSALTHLCKFNNFIKYNGTFK